MGDINKSKQRRLDKELYSVNSERVAFEADKCPHTRSEALEGLLSALKRVCSPPDYALTIAYAVMQIESPAAQRLIVGYPRGESEVAARIVGKIIEDGAAKGLYSQFSNFNHDEAANILGSAVLAIDGDAGKYAFLAAASAALKADSEPEVDAELDYALEL